MHSMTIGKRLYLCLSVMIGLCVVIGAIALFNLRRLNRVIDQLVQVDSQKLTLAGEINTAASDIAAIQRGVILRALVQDNAAITRHQREFAVRTDRIEQCLTTIEPHIKTTEGREITAGIRDLTAKVIGNQAEICRLIGAGQNDAALALYGNQSQSLTQQLNRLAEQLLARQRQLMQDTSRQASSISSASQWATLISLLGAFVLGGVVVAVVGGINKLLSRMVSALSSGAEQTSSAATQVSAASQSLAQGASEQAASIEETSASSQQISATAQHNSDNSRAATDLSVQTQRSFAETNELLVQTEQAVNEIHASSDKISKIIKVIDEIAFQTNILALNAAVEAARAGEAGMGFAVVADEVRNLAQRCAQAAQSTSELIADSIVKSGEGKARMDRMSAAIQRVTGESGKVKALIDEIHAGSQQQMLGTEQVSRAITQMESVTQKCAADAEECAAAAEELNAQSLNLKHLVGELTRLITGSHGHVAAIAA